MRTRSVRFRNGLAVVVVMVGLGGVAATQRTPPPSLGGYPTQRSGPPPPPPMQPIGIPDSRDPRVTTADDAAMRAAADKQARMRNDDRQKRLVSDTEKLLQLATQLHNDVAKTDKNVLSLDVIRRAEEIERLAHGVKDRMKG